MDVERIDDICDVLNNVTRKLTDLREKIYHYEKRIENLTRENQRLRDENDKLMIDVAFFDGKMLDKRSLY